MCLYRDVDGFVYNVIQNFERSLLLAWQANNFGNWFLSLRESAQSSRIWVSVDLFYEFERNEIENESLFVEYDNHHILPEFDVHDELVGVECNLRPVFFLVIVPNYHFVPLLLVHQHNYVSLVHHLDQGDVFIELLDLLLQPRASGVILQDFKAGLRGNGKILLSLVVRYSIYLGGRIRCMSILFFDSLCVRVSILLHALLVYHSLLGRHNVPVRI